ncbi:MAG: tRNA (adenosine(37)-N6)-dimethylallyltransferase MiaA [Gemmatimonadaceae bacterium]
MPFSANAPTSVINVITGPTAAGKSAIAMELARRFDLALISADSRQIYRGFDIGTAKPTTVEQSEVTHYGVDVRDPRDRYSAHAWAVDTIGWMQRSQSIGKSPVIVGGTGFYVRALVRPLAPAPALDAGRRRHLAGWLDQLETDALRKWCLRLDPARAHLGRTQLERAVETALLSGQRLGDVHAEHQTAATIDVDSAAPLAVRYLVVDPGAILAERIRNRVHAMVENGWINEITALQTSVPATAPAWLASGYDVMRQLAAGEIGRDAALERVMIETRQYAKRQRTWCRHQLQEGPVTRISPDEPHSIDRAIAWLRGTEAEA